MSRRTLAWGVVAATAWIVLAAVSADLSPLARRPLLDGLVPGAAYRWVDPPPELEPDNLPPSEATFVLRFRGGASEADVAFTPDNQVTVVATEGVIRDRNARELRLSITPEAPSSVAPLPGDLEPFGNVVLLEAVTEPGGPIDGFDEVLTVILVYPATANLHATAHELLWSADGRSWTSLDTTDSTAQQQAQAEIDAPGYVVVGGVAAAAPTVDGGSDGGRNTLSTILLVAAGASLLIGIGLLIRARGTER